MADCTGNFDLFCYMCGKFSIPGSKMRISSKCAERYEQYFGMSIIRNVKWAPQFICKTCDKELRDWECGSRNQLPFGVPMIWCDPGSLHDAANCYLCVNNPRNRNRVTRQHMVYKEVRHAQIPLPHSENIPVPTRSVVDEQSLDQFMASEVEEDNTYIPPVGNAQCNHIEVSQNRLNAIIRRLKLSKNQSVYLAGHLNAVNILAPGIKVASYKQRSAALFSFFSVNEENTIAHCNNIHGLMEAMKIEYNPEHWRLFLDASRTTLKAVLLYIDNSKNPVPIAMSTVTKETYESLRIILNLVHYDDHKWRICTDLKVTAILSGIRLGSVSNMCFLCLWDAHYKWNQYAKHDWKLRKDFLVGHASVVNVPLVPPEKILLPALHIKLGIVKNFIKCLGRRESPAIQRLTDIFPRLSKAKLKEGEKDDKIH